MRGTRDAPSRPAPREARACPICGQPASTEHRPFCSRRCADVDLHRWLGGRYVIPGREDEAASGDGAGEGED